MQMPRETYINRDGSGLSVKGLKIWPYYTLLEPEICPTFHMKKPELRLLPENWHPWNKNQTGFPLMEMARPWPSAHSFSMGTQNINELCSIFMAHSGVTSCYFFL
jgi:hypothetical protein